MKTPLLLSLLLCACVTQAPVSVTAKDNRSQQHVLVIGDGIDQRGAALYLMEQSETGWQKIAGPLPAVVGKNGLGKTREGDGRSPNGIFALNAVFGYAPSAPKDWRMPYLPMSAEHECVDDEASKHYNRILRPEGTGGKNWHSAEQMRRDIFNHDNLYQWGLVVDYNTPVHADPVSGRKAGSCIFLHLWSGPDSYTAGCTAFSPEHMQQLLHWLDKAKRPLLVQGDREFLQQLIDKGELAYALP